MLFFGVSLCFGVLTGKKFSKAVIILVRTCVCVCVVYHCGAVRENVNATYQKTGESEC